MKIILNILVFTVLIFTLISCGDENELVDMNFNSYGSFTRNNSFENNQFFGKIVVADYFDHEDTSGAAQPLLILDDTRYIFTTAHGNVISIKSNSVEWTVNLGDNTMAASLLAADKNRNIYVVSTNGILQSISYLGKKNWNFDLSKHDTVSSYYTDILVNDDGIYLGTERGSFFKFSFDGKLDWQKKFDSYLTRTFSSDFNSNIYLILTQNSYEESDTLIKLSKDGDELARTTIDGIRLIKHPVINYDKVYLSGLVKIGYQILSKVICLDTNLTAVWEKELSVTPRYLSASIDSTLFVIGYNSGIGESMSGVFALDNKGELKWKLYFDATVTCPLMLSEKYVVFAGLTLDGPGLFFMSKEEGRLAKTIALNNENTTLLKPSVSDDGIILLPISDQLGIISVDDTPFNKMLPY